MEPVRVRRPIRIAVLVSGHGRGTNLQALIDACSSREIPGDVVMVVGTRGSTPAIARAKDAGVDTVILSSRRLGDEEAYSAALQSALKAAHTDLICLAGYMRKLPTEVIAAYPNAVMNVHAALLPLFGGQGMYGEHVHRAVLESGMKVAGCTVHFVDEQYDSGPIIVQTAVPVMEDDTPESLGGRVLAVENRALVTAARLFAEGRLAVDGRRVHISDAPA